MIHSPFGTGKKRRANNLNETKDEDSILLQARNHSAFGKQLELDQQSFSKSIHQGSIKKFQVKSHFQKQVENTNQKRIKQMKQAKPNQQFARPINDHNQTLPLNDQSQNNFLYGWGQSRLNQFPIATSDSTRRNLARQPKTLYNQSIFPRPGNFQAQHQNDPRLGFTNQNVYPQGGFPQSGLPQRNQQINPNLESRPWNPNQINQNQRMTNHRESNSNQFYPNYSPNVQNFENFGIRRNLQDQQEQKKVHFGDVVQIQNQENDFKIKTENEQQWIAPNRKLRPNQSSLSAADRQSEVNTSNVNDGMPNPVRTSILKSCVFPQAQNQSNYHHSSYLPVHQPQPAIPNRSHAHQFLSSFLPPHFKLQPEIPLQMPPRMTQTIELARTQRRGLKRRDIAELGIMIYMIQNKMLLWEYRSGRYGEKDFQEGLKEVRVIKLAGKEIYFMLEYQNQKMDIIRVAPQGQDTGDQGGPNCEPRQTEGGDGEFDESHVVRIEITEKPIINPNNTDRIDQSVRIEMDQNQDPEPPLPHLPEHSNIPLTLRIEKVQRNLRNLKITFARWVPEMNALFFIDTLKRVSTAVWDEELNQLRIRQQNGGASAGAPGPAPKFKGLKRIKKKVVALFSGRRHYSYRLKTSHGLIYLLKTTFAIQKPNSEPLPQGSRLHDIFDNPLYLMDLPSFATAFYSSRTQKLEPGQSPTESFGINPKSRTPPNIRIISQKILNFAIRPDGQLIPRGNLNLSKVFKINTATLNCHFAGSGGYDFANRIVDFKIQPEDRDQLLDRALSRCDGKEKLDLGEAVGHLRDVVEDVTQSQAFEEARLVSRHIILLMENGVEVQIEPFEGLVTQLEILSLQRDAGFGKSVFLGYLSEGEVLFSRGQTVYMLTKNSLQLLDPSTAFTTGRTANHHPLLSSQHSRTRQVQDLRPFSHSSVIYDLRHNYSAPSNQFSFTKSRLLTSDKNPFHTKFQKSLFPRLAAQSHLLISETKGRMRPVRLLKSNDFLASLLWLMGLEIEANGDIGPYLGMLASLVEVWGLKEIVKSLLYLFSIEEISKAQVSVQYDWMLSLGRTFRTRIPQIRGLKNPNYQSGETGIQTDSRFPDRDQNEIQETKNEPNGHFDQEWLIFEDLPRHSQNALELTDSRFFRLKQMVLCMLKVFGGLGARESSAVIRTLLQSRITAEAVKDYQVTDESEIKIDLLHQRLKHKNHDPNNSQKLAGPHRHRDQLRRDPTHFPKFGALEITLLEIFSFDLERICKKPLLTSEFSPQRSMVPLLNRDSQKIRKSMFASLWSILGIRKDRRARSVIIEKQLAPQNTLNDLDQDIYQDWHGGRHGYGIAGALGFDQFSFWDAHLPARQHHMLEDDQHQSRLLADDQRNNFNPDDQNPESTQTNANSDQPQILELKLLKFIRSKFGDDLLTSETRPTKIRPRTHRLRLNVGLLELKKLLEKSTYLNQLIAKLKTNWVKSPFSGLGTQIIRNINKYGSPHLSDLIYGFLENFPAEKNLTGLERVIILSTLFLNLLIIDNISPKYLERGLWHAQSTLKSPQAGLKQSFLSSDLDSLWRGLCVELSGKFFFDKSGILRFFFKEPVAQLLEELELLKTKLKQEAKEIEFQRRHHHQSAGIEKQRSTVLVDDLNLSSDEDASKLIKEKPINYSKVYSSGSRNQQTPTPNTIRETKQENSPGPQYKDTFSQHKSCYNPNTDRSLTVDKSPLSQELKSVYYKIRGVISDLEVGHLNSLMPIFTCRGFPEDALMFIELMCAKFSDLSEVKRFTEETAKKEIERLEDQLKTVTKHAVKNKEEHKGRSFGEQRPNPTTTPTFTHKSGVPRQSTASNSLPQHLPLETRLQTVRSTLQLNLQQIASQQKSIKLFFVSFLITSERFRTLNEHLSKQKTIQPSTWETIVTKTKNFFKTLISGYGKETRHFRFNRESFEGFLGWLSPKQLAQLYKNSLQILLAQNDEDLRLFALETALTLNQSRRLSDVEDSLQEDDLVQLLNKNPRMEGKVGVQNMLFLIHFFSKKKRYAMAVDLVLKVCRGDYLPLPKREAAQADPARLLQILANIFLQRQRYSSVQTVSPQQDTQHSPNLQAPKLPAKQNDNSSSHSLHEAQLLSLENSLNIDSYITLEKKLALLSRTAILLGSLGQPEERRVLSRRLKEQTSLLKLQQTIQTELRDVVKKLNNILTLPDCYDPQHNVLRPTVRVFQCLSAQLEHGLLPLPVLIERVIRPFKLFNGLDSYLKHFVMAENFFEQNYFANLLQAIRHYSMSGSIESSFRLKNFVQLRGSIELKASENNSPLAQVIDLNVNKHAMSKFENQTQNEHQATLLLLESTNLATYNPSSSSITLSNRNSVRSDNHSQQSEIHRIEAIAALAKSNLIFPYNIYPPMLNSLTHFIYLDPQAYKELKLHSTSPSHPKNRKQHSKFAHANSQDPTAAHSRRDDAIVQNMLSQQKLALISTIESASAMNSFVDLLMRRRTCERLYHLGIKEVESLWFSDHLIKNEPEVGESYTIFDLYFHLWDEAHRELASLNPNKNPKIALNSPQHRRTPLLQPSSERTPNRYQRRSRNAEVIQEHNSSHLRNNLNISGHNQSEPVTRLNMSSDQLAARHHSTTRMFITCLQLIHNLMCSQETHYERFLLTPDTHLAPKQELAAYLLKFEVRVQKLERIFLGMDSRQTQNCLLSFGNDSFLMLGDSLKRKLFQYLKSPKRGKLKAFQAKYRHLK